ncbi:hypothetical protein BofuT4_P088680.1 [Botrytis cinerea T4]|uniref:Uncharacterized protein n=1 Tax=Botryotinia fuckeliana (strain T4) TaxID=999810 RepID=G2YFC1_BOTF4|nr:hypothetical protein BofuT4_P088680.1 [Botrytis cinerea T4]
MERNLGLGGHFCHPPTAAPTESVFHKPMPIIYDSGPLLVFCTVVDLMYRKCGCGLGIGLARACALCIGIDVS